MHELTVRIPEDIALANPELSIEVVNVTPTMARDFLNLNPSNRPKKNKHIQKMSENLTIGNWVFNGATIVFDWNGELDDGQHRCEAIIDAGLPMPTIIIRGVSPESKKTLDTGVPRTASDVLVMDGLNLKIARMVGDAMKRDMFFRDYGPNNFKSYYGSLNLISAEVASPTGRGMVDLAELLLTYRKSIAITPTLLTFIGYRMFRIDEEFFCDWIPGLMTGENLAADDARLWVRNKFVHWKDTKVADSVNRKMAMIIQAWHKSRMAPHLYATEKAFFRSSYMANFRHIKLPTDKW